MNVSLSSRFKFFFARLNWDVVLILFLGFLSITWFRGDYLISGGDFGLPLDRLKYLRLMFSSWDETYSMGAPNPRQLASLIPYALWGGITEALGLSLIFWEKSLFYFWFAGAGLSMYYLCSVLEMPRLGKLATSFFYMLNPFSLIIIWLVSHGLIQMPYAFAPLVLGMYVRGCKGGRGWRHIILANFVWVLTTASAYANPRMAVVHWLPIGFWTFWAFVFHPQQRRTVFKYCLGFLGVWGLLNFYWILPVVSSLGESMASAHSPFLMPDAEQFKLTSVKFLEAIRMLGYWSMKGGYKGEPYYSFWRFYASGLGNWLSWLIPVLGVLGIWGIWRGFGVRKSGKIEKWFLLSLVVFGLIGISGAHPPFGKFLIWLYQLFPPLGLLTRFNFLFFGMPTYLVFSILFGWGFLTVYELGRRWFGEMIWVFLGVLGILLGIVLVWPFWNGEVIRAEGKLFPGERFKVPGYWWEAKKWLAGQKEFFRIFPLPMSKTYNVAFDWEKGYSGGDPTRWFVSQPVLNANVGESFQVPMLIGEAIERQTRFKDIGKLLGFLNVKYLLVREDTKWEFLEGHGWWFYQPLERIEEFIQSQNGLSLEKEIGKLKFYQLADDYLLPQIYTPQTITFIDGEVAGLEDIIQFLKPEEEQAFVLGKEGEFIWRRPTVPEKEGKKDLSRAIYEIQAGKRGKYEILLRDDGFMQFYHSGQVFRISLDDESIQERTPVVTEDNLISLGEIELTTGTHLITIFPPLPINLVNNASFEEAIAGHERSEDAFKGSYALKVPADKETNVASIPISNFRVGDAYRLSFAAKYLQGTAAILVLWENYTDSPTPIFKLLDNPFGMASLETNYSQIEVPPVSSWQDFEITFNASPNAKLIGLSFASVPNAQGDFVVGRTENLFDDVKVQRVFTNPMVLKRVDKKSSLAVNPPKISFKKISSVKYEVEIREAKEPFWLVFSEAFHPGWKASVAGEHIEINGFANGWYIKKTGNYKFNIFFEPQKILWFGMAVSGLTTLLCLVYLGYKFLAPRRGRELKFARTILL